MSVRVRLTAAAAGVMALALAGGAVVLVAVVGHGLLRGIDAAARDRADEATASSLSDAAVAAGPADAVLQVVGADGSVAGGSANAAGLPRLFTFAPSRAVRTAGRLPLPDTADSYRVAVARRTDGGLVYVALPSDDAREATHLLAVALAGGVPVAVALLALVTWVLVGRALVPVDEAMRRQRDFVGDAAHELRAPLAALRTRLETGADTGEVLGDVRRLGALVDDLLHLARLDGHAPARRRLDLDDVVFRETAQARAATAKTVDATGVSAAQVDGDAAALAHLVRNLLDNAVRHAATRVEVALGSRDGEVLLTVTDDGAGIDPAERERVFERFARADEARGRDSGGYGLGLAIVRAVATAHGGSVRVADHAPGARMEVRLPAAR